MSIHRSLVSTESLSVVAAPSGDNARGRSAIVRGGVISSGLTSRPKAPRCLLVRVSFAAP